MKIERQDVSHHNSGENHPLFNPIIKIRKKYDKCYKQGYFYFQPCNCSGELYFSAVDKDRIIEKVKEFLDSNLNTYGYTDYEFVEEDESSMCCEGTCCGI